MGEGFFRLDRLIIILLFIKGIVVVVVKMKPNSMKAKKIYIPSIRYIGIY